MTRLFPSAALAALAFGALAAPASAQCTFTTTGTTMKLDADCVTTSSIVVPNGFTLDGMNRTITAADPVLGHFLGGVIVNGGATAHVKHLRINTLNLANVCDAGNDRLRGILFDGASGTIEHNEVVGINQGPSGCQEGNGIEVRKDPFDGTHPAPATVVIQHNKVEDYQKTGIVVNGDVFGTVAHNDVGSSATQLHLAANGIQIGFGAVGTVDKNKVGGNSWCTDASAVATGILVFGADNTVVTDNHVKGDADVGIYFFADNGVVEGNQLDDGASVDCNLLGVDVGIGNYGTGNTVKKNKIKGYQTPIDQ